MHLLRSDASVYLDMDGPLAEESSLLGENFACAIGHDRENISPKLLGQIECALMETGNGAVWRTRPFWIDNDAVAPVDERLQFGHQRRQPLRNGIEFGTLNQGTVEGIVPNPVLGQYYELGSMNQHRHQVETRLMVADNDGWFSKVFATRICHRKPDARDAVPQSDKAGITPKQSVHRHASLLQIPFRQHVIHCQRFDNEDGRKDKEQQGVNGAQQGG